MKTSVHVHKSFVIWLDTLLLILFILLLSPRMTGLSLHEILGIVIFVPILIHLLLAWPWIRYSVRQYFKTSTLRNKINFILNTILFILMMVEIISGIGISQVALPFFDVSTINDRTWRALHNQTLNFIVLFVGLHIAMNWDWIVSAFRKKLSVNSKLIHFAPNLLSILFRTCIILISVGVVTFFIYSLFGPPTMERVYVQDEIARFSPTAGHGLGQCAGETFLIAVCAYVAKRWLRVRL